MVSGVVLPLVVQHPLVLSYGFLWGSRPSCFVLLRWLCACLMVLFVACPTCVIVGNVASVCPTVIIIVGSFYIFGVDELSCVEMLSPWLLLLSSAGVAVCISWIPTVSVVASVAVFLTPSDLPKSS